jgi:hypothetical protein
MIRFSFRNSLFELASNAISVSKPKSKLTNKTSRGSLVAAVCSRRRQIELRAIFLLRNIGLLSFSRVRRVIHRHDSIAFTLSLPITESGRKNRANRNDTATGR